MQPPRASRSSGPGRGRGVPVPSFFYLNSAAVVRIGGLLGDHAVVPHRTLSQTSRRQATEAPTRS
jgi:hypothetical protein